MELFRTSETPRADPRAIRPATDLQANIDPAGRNPNIRETLLGRFPEPSGRPRITIVGSPE